MPRAITSPESSPRISTVSPATKSPCTSVTPACSNEVLRCTSAWRAPSSTNTDPAICAAKAIHNLRADSCRSCGRNWVPTVRSPATASDSTFSLRAAAITVRTPDHEAIRAAESLLAIPPLPRAVPDAPAFTESNGSSADTISTKRASALFAGSSVYSPSMSVNNTNRSA